MRAPCDETLIRSGSVAAPCKPDAGPWILTATILASSMAFIDSTVVNVAIPTLQKAFHATVVDVQWVVESYGLFLSALILAGGALGDLVGRRRMFLLGVAVFAGASAACGLAPSVETLVIARCVQGVGAALFVPVSLSIIGSSFDEKSRGQAIVTWSRFTAITTALGPVLGGWLIEHGSWRWAFFLNVPIACAVAVISFWRVPESRGSSVAHIDWLGALLATAGLGGVVTAFLESARFGWRNPLVFGSLLAGVACLVIFVLVEAHSSSPMLPPELFKSRPFSGTNLITLFLYAAVGIFFFLFPMNLIQLHGYSTTATGAVVMSSVDQDHVGTASGINNAVARVAGVLAIAVFGIVMVKAFGSELDQALVKLSLPQEILQNIRSKQIELAGMELPQGLDAHAVETLRHAITSAFLSSFRLIMFLCAALSTASAIIAWRWIASTEVASRRSG